MKSFINDEEGFPGGWEYFQQETGFVIKATHWHQLVTRVRDHRKANNIPVNARLEQDIIDQLCAKCPERCRDTEPPTLAQQSLAFAKSLVKWLRNGMPCVSFDEYQRRKNICNGCSQFRGEAALGIGKCGGCGCTSIKLFLATEHCPPPYRKW